MTKRYPYKHTGTQKTRGQLRRLLLAGGTFLGGVFLSLGAGTATGPTEEPTAPSRGPTFDAATLGFENLQRDIQTSSYLQPLNVTGLCTDNPLRNKGRALTRYEVALIRLIFNTEVDAENIRLHKRGAPRDSKESVAFVKADNPCNIYLVDPKLQDTKDFARTSNIWAFQTFVHEVVHLWQVSRLDVFPHCKTYTYTPTDTSHLLQDFCAEQQAEIISDYARAFLFPQGSLPPIGTPNSRENIENIRRMSESIFPWLAAARHHVANMRKAHISCKDSAAEAFNLSQDRYALVRKTSECDVALTQNTERLYKVALRPAS